MGKYFIQNETAWDLLDDLKLWIACNCNYEK